MSFLESQAKAGYYPTPPDLLPHIAAFVTPGEGSLLDPCCGKGEAAAFLAKAWNLQGCGIEINHARAVEASIASVPKVRDRGAAGDREAQLIRTVHDDRARTPDLTAEQPRKTGRAEHIDRAAATTISTAKTGDAAAASAPKAKARKAPPPKADETSAMSTGPKESTTGGEK